MDNWDEVRTAYQVARQGTVSGAAQAMGVHHATVIRHIDALETRLGVKLFQRHARGYAPTEAGQDLLQVAQTTEDQFAQLQSRIKGQGAEVAGDFTVTTLSALTPMMVQPFRGFQIAHPGIRLNVMTGARLFRLEYGEAHAAIRAGSVPNEPDNVVRKLMDLKLAMYATPDYVDAHGMLHGQSYGEHFFIGGQTDTPAPYLKWLNENVPQDNIVFRASDQRVQEDALLAGAGVGFMAVTDAVRFPNLIQMAPPNDEWSAPIWLVTHVDLHRTAKVQAFVHHMLGWSKQQ